MEQTKERIKEQDQRENKKLEHLAIQEKNIYTRDQRVIDKFNSTLNDWAK